MGLFKRLDDADLERARRRADVRRRRADTGGAPADETADPSPTETADRPDGDAR